MAAATIDYARDFAFLPNYVREVRMSAMTSDQSEDVAHGGPSGSNVSYMTWEVDTPPSILCAFTVIHDRTNDNTTNNTARVKVVAEAGGDLAGLVIRLFFNFKNFKRGGNVNVD